MRKPKCTHRRRPISVTLPPLYVGVVSAWHSGLLVTVTLIDLGEESGRAAQRWGWGCDCRASMVREKTDGGHKVAREAARSRAQLQYQLDGKPIASDAGVGEGGWLDRDGEGLSRRLATPSELVLDVPGSVSRCQTECSVSIPGQFPRQNALASKSASSSEAETVSMPGCFPPPRPRRPGIETLLPRPQPPLADVGSARRGRRQLPGRRTSGKGV
jgi:hypothetical protein